MDLRYWLDTHIFCGFFWVASGEVQGVSNRFNMEPQRWPYNLIVEVWWSRLPQISWWNSNTCSFLSYLGNDVSKLVKKEKFINSGIFKYLEFWKLNILRDEMYARVMKPSIHWISRVYFRMLVKTNSSTKSRIIRGLLATSNWKVNHVRFSIPSIPILHDMEYLVIPLYCGLKTWSHPWT
jgi:hypothetical protein